MLLPVQLLQLGLEPALAAVVHNLFAFSLPQPALPAAAVAVCIPPVLARTVVAAVAGQQLVEQLWGFFEPLGFALESDDHSWC